MYVRALEYYATWRHLIDLLQQTQYKTCCLLIQFEYFLFKSKITKVRHVYKFMGAKYHLDPFLKSGGVMAPMPLPPMFMCTIVVCGVWYVGGRGILEIATQGCLHNVCATNGTHTHTHTLHLLSPSPIPVVLRMQEV